MDWIAIVSLILSAVQALWPIISAWFSKPSKAVANRVAAQLKSSGKLATLAGPADVLTVASAMRESAKTASPLLRVIMNKVAAKLEANSEAVWNHLVTTGAVPGTTVPVPKESMQMCLPVHQDVDDLLTLTAAHLPESVFTEENMLPTLSLSNVIAYLMELPQVKAIMAFVPTVWFKQIMDLVHPKAADIAIPMTADAVVSPTMPPDIEAAIIAGLKQIAAMFSGKPVIQMVMNAMINTCSDFVLQTIWSKIVAYISAPVAPATPVLPVGPVVPAPTPAGPATPVTPPSTPITPAVAMTAMAEPEVVDHVGIVGCL